MNCSLRSGCDVCELETKRMHNLISHLVPTVYSATLNRPSQHFVPVHLQFSNRVSDGLWVIKTVYRGLSELPPNNGESNGKAKLKMTRRLGFTELHAQWL